MLILTPRTVRTAGERDKLRNSGLTPEQLSKLNTQTARSKRKLSKQNKQIRQSKQSKRSKENRQSAPLFSHQNWQALHNANKKLHACMHYLPAPLPR